MRTFWRILPLGVIAALAFFVFTQPADDADGERDVAVDEPVDRAGTKRPRRYRAEWILDAGAAGREEPGQPYLYVEIIDDPNGRTLVQTATHLAVQDLESSAICAAIFAPENQTSCARVQRPDGVPNVASIAVMALRDWSPKSVFEVAGPDSMGAATTRSPEAWETRTDSHRGVPVNCFTVIAETFSAPTGFDICYTADGNELIASLDLTGDDFLEVDLQLYASDVTDDSFEVGFDLPVDPTIYEQLVFIHPQVPVGALDLSDPTNDGAESS